MRLTRRGRNIRDVALATLLTILLAFAASLDAEAAPPPPVQESVQEARSVLVKKPWICKDKAARILYQAGFTGYAHKQAWAVTWRESKHQNLDESSPWYSGALGMWQIQTSAHAGKPWWSRAAMLDPLRQSKIVYKWTKGGKYWAPWGLTADGQLDPSQYGSWGPSLWEAWIMAPFRTGLSLYPCKTTPPKN
jgi:hypothetical protein